MNEWQRLLNIDPGIEGGGYGTGGLGVGYLPSPSGRPNSLDFLYREAAPKGVDYIGGSTPIAALLGSIFNKAISSGRAGGAFRNRVTKVSKYVENNITPDNEVLDFGAGKGAYQSKYLGDKGYKVTPYDLPENTVSGVHDPNALTKQYDTVMASNVMNVQPNLETFKNTMSQMYNSVRPGGRIVANFPKEPNHIGLSLSEVHNILTDLFPNVTRNKDLFVIEK